MTDLKKKRSSLGQGKKCLSYAENWYFGRKCTFEKCNVKYLDSVFNVKYKCQRAS